MVLGYHVILAAYGFWLPNDPRGSWSTEVWAAHLQPFGPPTKTDDRRSLAHAPHDQEARRSAKEALHYPAVRFTPAQIQAVAAGFAAIAPALALQILACAILSDHIHLVIGRAGDKIEIIAGFLKRAATRSLNAAGCNPMHDYRNHRGRCPSLWADRGWYRYLDNDGSIRLAIDYVEQNPKNAGLAPQQWDFVTPFVGY
jgi:REP element-mobilizing transposase RayT